MNLRTSFIFATLLLTTLSVSAIDLDAGFRNPPETTKPYCFWYWLNADITADGITKDLESMAKVGIKQAMIGNIEGGGPVKTLGTTQQVLFADGHIEKVSNRMTTSQFVAKYWPGTIGNVN